MTTRDLIVSALLSLVFSIVSPAEPERIPLQVRENIRIIDLQLQGYAYIKSE